MAGPIIARGALAAAKALAKKQAKKNAAKKAKKAKQKSFEEKMEQAATEGGFKKGSGKKFAKTIEKKRRKENKKRAKRYKKDPGAEKRDLEEAEQLVRQMEDEIARTHKGNTTKHNKGGKVKQIKKPAGTRKKPAPIKGMKPIQGKKDK